MNVNATAQTFFRGPAIYKPRKNTAVDAEKALTEICRGLSDYHWHRLQGEIQIVKDALKKA